LNEQTQAPSVSVQHTKAALPDKSDNDVVIVSAVRTPIGKSKRGNLKDTHWTDMLAHVLKEVVDHDPKVKSGIKKEDVDDIHVGIVLAPGGGATQARQAMFLAGYPVETSITTLNRQCSSGLQAVANIAAAIKNGYIKVGVAAGVESMSGHDMIRAVGEVNEKIFDNAQARDCLLSMGQTSENVAEQFGVTREDQDQFAYESYRKAVAAIKNGKFKQEIVPLETEVVKQDGSRVKVTVSEDEGPRETTLESLKKLKPAFKPEGTSTAGNSSQTSDGAAAVLLMSRAEAQRRGLPVMGRFLGFHVAGVPPAVMGIGPAVAIPGLLNKFNLTVEQIDDFEINEAFASQALYSIRKLGIPINRVNPLGGAIALGHPLGCTGARQVSTLLYQMRREKQNLGVISMCIGTGMGAAGLIQAEY
jgi:acetyl-CoA acyltransferase 1